MKTKTINFPVLTAVWGFIKETAGAWFFAWIFLMISIAGNVAAYQRAQQHNEYGFELLFGILFGFLFLIAAFGIIYSYIQDHRDD